MHPWVHRLAWSTYSRFRQEINPIKRYERENKTSLNMTKPNECLSVIFRSPRSFLDLLTWLISLEESLKTMDLGKEESWTSSWTRRRSLSSCAKLLKLFNATERIIPRQNSQQSFICWLANTARWSHCSINSSHLVISTMIPNGKTSLTAENTCL